MANTIPASSPGQIAPPPSAILRGPSSSQTLRRWLGLLFGQKYGVYSALLVLVVLSSIITQGLFLKPENIITNVLKPSALLGIVAIGQTIVIIAGGIDLSVASIIAAVSVITAYVMDGQDSLVLPISLLCLFLASLVGLANGLMVAKRGIPPFIGTLATMLIVQGWRFLYTGGAPRGSIPPLLRFFGRGDIGPIPTAVVIVFITGVLAWILLRRTTFGRQVYAVGGNARAARLSGINVDRVVILAYVLCSFLAGATGLVLTGYIGLADNWLGKGMDLDSIAAAVVGGALFSGGRGSVWGTMAGVLIIEILFNVVLLMRWDQEVQLIVKGVAIVGAVALYARSQSSR